MIAIPSFGETNGSEHRENRQAVVWNLPQTEENRFDDYCRLLEQDGFICREERTEGKHRFAAYAKADCGVFINDFRSVQELSIVMEENCRYFDYTDTGRSVCVSPQITQIALEDFGMSYVIRLSDGRFIVIDGGRHFPIEQDKLFRCLSEGAPQETPVIAAWIMSHPHSDHFNCFIGFMDRFGDQVKIEKFLFNFPEADDLAHYPALAVKDKRFEDTSSLTNIPRMLERIQRTGAPVYMAHTGQRYRIGDARCEILSSMDDTIHCSENINATSLVIRMELAGQIILWNTDASYSIARLPEKYGSYLKADIMQVPHHGFQSGTAEAEIEGYQLVQPSVCLLPVSDYNAFNVFCTHREGTRFLMRDAGVEEMISGDQQRTLTLPYRASRHGKKELERKYLAGRESCGANTWVFMGLHTSCPEDFVFTLLNVTHVAATVWVELFFEDPARKVRNIKAEIGATRMCTINIVGDEVDGSAMYFTWLSLKEQGVPDNVPFAVRFVSEVPIVVQHSRHEASYRSTASY